MMADRRVFDGGHLRATLVEQPGPDGAAPERLMVTFDFRRVNREGFDPAPQTSSFARQGFALLKVQTRRNDWFINPDTTALEAALPGIVAGFREVRMLGYSMGGYGTFRFAAAAGARFVVAVSPQASIAPSVVPFDRRYRGDSAGFDPRIGDLGPVARPDLTRWIVLDPFVRADLRHARVLQAHFPGVGLARLNFGGHPATAALRDAGRAREVPACATQTMGQEPILQAAHRGARRQSARYWLALASRAGKRRPTLASTARAMAAQLQGKGGQNRPEAG